MILKIILLISILSLPTLSTANETKPKSTSIKLESMDIKSLIEKAKFASLEDRTKIENLIKQKIAKAHRENYKKG